MSYEKTKHEQLPELSLSLIGEFYLRGRLELKVPLTTAPATDPCSSADSHWRSAEAIGTLAAFEDHLVRYPTCNFATLAKASVVVRAVPGFISSEGLMEQVDIRRHDVNSDLWSVSSPSGDDVAYITYLGNSYFVWATEPAPADIVGKRFDTVDAAVAAVVKSVFAPLLTLCAGGKKNGRNCSGRLRASYVDIARCSRSWLSRRCKRGG